MTGRQPVKRKVDAPANYFGGALGDFPKIYDLFGQIPPKGMDIAVHKPIQGHPEPLLDLAGHGKRQRSFGVLKPAVGALIDPQLLDEIGGMRVAERLAGAS